MEPINLDSWTKFDFELTKIRKKYPPPIKIRFRGQSNEAWDLETTLERKTEDKFDVLKYTRHAAGIINELESFTGQRWNIPAYNELKKEVQENQTAAKVHIPMYGYLVYLRHHGFPSPLLDWTESAYVAAYFAYMNSTEDNPAVYCYIERLDRTKAIAVNNPRITAMGPFVSTHARHFAQKASYTIATCWDQTEEKHTFCPHKRVFSGTGNDTQDVLIKIVLPAKGRGLALRSLDEHNINHFTLFQSEDALVKTLEIKSFDFTAG